MTMTRSRLASFSASAVALCTLVSAPAFAHHPTGGQLPDTVLNGLLSGLGHPVIGLDHFAFVVGIGLLAAVAGFGPLLPVAFVAAMAGGLALHVAGIGLPGAELMVAASVLLIGLAVARPRLGGHAWIEGGVFALAGTVHGYALAESIIGAEASVLGAYIAGLVAMQTTVALLAYWTAYAILAPAERRLSPIPIRVAGIAIFAIGVLVLAQTAAIAS